jgi:hypothetical protein
MLTEEIPGDCLPPDLASVAEFLDRRGAADPAWLLGRVTEQPETHAAVTALKQDLLKEGVLVEPDGLERLLLLRAFRAYEPKLDTLPVCTWVRDAIRREASSFLQHRPTTPLHSGGPCFTAAAKIVTGRRFPAGPMDWELSGIPRSWLFQVRPMRIPALLWFVARQLGGLRPLFFMHVASPPKQRTLVIGREVLRSYYRMAVALGKQPGVRGIMTCGWLTDPAVATDLPHLKTMQDIYLENGGFLEPLTVLSADTGPNGKHYRQGLALWARKDALAWAEKHPELAPA